MSPRQSHHVVHNPKGGWDSKKGGGSKAIKHFDRKKEAIDFTRDVFVKRKGDHLLIEKGTTLAFLATL
jgi:hypothetical protein